MLYGQLPKKYVFRCARTEKLKQVFSFSGSDISVIVVACLVLWFLDYMPMYKNVY